MDQEQSKATASPQDTLPQSAAPQRKRRFGDRYDGYRVRNLDLPFYLVPNIMRTRLDSQNFLCESVNIGEAERYLRKKRAEDLPNLRMIHIILAALVRTFSQRPRLNRFVAGKKIYAHNNLRFSMTVKREMSEDGEESNILPVFEPTDTIYQVAQRFEEALADCVNEDTKSGNKTDGVNRALAYIPTGLKSFVIFFFRNLDKVGLMPKAIYRASPFHSSAFVTDVGSLGIDSIYHHLYEFGTTTCFVAVGKKQYVPFVRRDGTLGEHKAINFRFVLDERVCDGFYYASALKLFRKYIRHPELLELPPEELPQDY